MTTSDGWPLPPQPRAMPVPPASLKADQMVFMVGSKPDDTDNNGYPDAIRASVALFSSAHPTALRENGTFVFMLYSQGASTGRDARPFAQWRVTGEALKVFPAQYGPCYLFTLSLIPASAMNTGGTAGAMGGAGIPPVAVTAQAAAPAAAGNGDATASAAPDSSAAAARSPAGDRMPSERADMICRFEPADGSPPVLCSGVRTIQIGGRRALP